jgi:GH18 family chitinase
MIIAAYFFLFDDGYTETMKVADDIPWQKINRLYIAFASVKDGVLSDKAIDEREDSAEDRIRNVVSLCRNANPNAEIFISSDFGDQSVDDEYIAAARDPDRFAQSVLQYLKKYDLDGYDMDWESRRINDYSQELTALLCSCFDTLKQAGQNPHGGEYKLSHTIWPGVHEPQTVGSLKDCVDNINLMTYGPGDAYDLKQYADSYYEAGFPREKMIGGAESEFGYPENGGHDTVDSIEEKCAYVRANDMAGMFSWRLDNDMRTIDGISEGGPPTFQVAGWLYDALSR